MDDAESVSCDLDEVLLDEEPRFEALSYTWENQEPSVSIKCAGQSFLVTPNCFSALRQLRKTNRVRMLWVDSICIDQTSIPERNQQVSMMGEIYRNADRVIVWLGESDAPTIQSMRKIAAITEYGDIADDSLQAVLHQRVEALKTGESRFRAENPSSDVIGPFFRRSWFTRLWTIQEVVLAKGNNVEIYCGDEVLSWISVLEVVDALRAKGYPWGEFKKATQLQKYLTTMMLAERYPEARSLLEAKPGDTVTRPHMSHILLYARDKASTDPKDRIYALLDWSDVGYSDVDPRQAAIRRFCAAGPSDPLWSFTADYQHLNVSGKIVDTIIYRTATLDVKIDPRIARFSLTSFSRNRAGQWIIPDFARDLLASFKVLRTWVEVSTWYAQYPTSETVKSALKRTLLNDNPDVYARRPRFDQAFEAWYDVMTATDVNLMAKVQAANLASVPLQQQEEYLRACLREISEEVWMLKVSYSSEVSAYHSLALAFSNKKCLFTTENGYMGTGPDLVRVDDQVALIAGMSTPVILRPLDGGFEYVTHAYVHGLMYGDAWPENKAELQEIVLI
ncbi:MAG: hypothetical protein Q9167_003175 [Letrouitia subvulpina]